MRNKLVLALGALALLSGMMSIPTSRDCDPVTGVGCLRAQLCDPVTGIGC